MPEFGWRRRNRLPKTRQLGWQGVGTYNIVEFRKSSAIWAGFGKKEAMTQLEDLRDHIRMSNRGDLDFALELWRKGKGEIHERGEALKIVVGEEETPVRLPANCSPIASSPRTSSPAKSRLVGLVLRPRPADDEMKIISNELRLLKVE